MQPVGQGRAKQHSSSASERIIRIGRNAWRAAEATDSGILVDAADYYRAFYARAREARHYILMSGWQFDSGVRLLRGREATPGAEVRLLEFLNGLCTEKQLEVYILAWDFHVLFALEREWMQRVYFHWMTHSAFHFLFDDFPVAGGSHHQKFVVIDGVDAFVGGMDICEGRWDDRRHLGENELRLSRGRPDKPYHDVQAHLVGSGAVGVLEDLFWEHWTCAGGERRARAIPTGGVALSRPRGLLALGPSEVAFSRTQPLAEGDGIREVESLFVDAIDSAERLIYLETQYFSSRRIYEALAARMQRPGGSRLEIVVAVNQRAEALKEEVAVGLRQAENLERLRDVAAATGHALGLYYSLCEFPTEAFRTTYIHSKVAIVDDRFLTVGSANLTNRSMGIDSELHVSWEAGSWLRDSHRFIRAIRRVRISLLAEHGGLSGIEAVRQLYAIEGLVGRLDAFTTRPGVRLQRHGPPTPWQRAAMEILDPESLPGDPDTSEGACSPDLSEPVDEGSHRSQTPGLQSVSRLLRRIWLPLAHRVPDGGSDGSRRS